MIVLSALYKIFIGPLELFFEVVFSIAYRFIGDPGLSIIFLSLAMNFLVLPLYRRADAMQEAERDRAAEMQPWVTHIKKAFKGDERFMMLQTYYRQIGYKQTDALKGSVSLLLEIPFFIAAYHFLSNLELLKGVPFGPITDLGAPDALIQIGDVSINFLPILMTLINVVSAAIYMKGFPLKSKVQMYGIAAIFLVLLYASPAGLVFYWTLNNIFSLVKNLFYKMKNPGRVLAVLASAAGIFTLIAAFFLIPPNSPRAMLFLVVCALLLQIPLLSRVLKKRGVLKPLNIPEADSKDDTTFVIGCVFMALLTGALIPISVIQASPAEFVTLSAFREPLWYVFDSLCLAIGTFVVWLGVFYRLATPSGKYVFGAALWAACGVALVNYLLFGTGYGNLSSLLQFDRLPEIGLRDIAINAAVLAVVTAALLFIWHKRKGVARVAYASLSIAIVAVSVMGVFSINEQLEPSRSVAFADQDERPHFTLSKEGQNVVVIMMDRCISYYVPYIMNERPELQKQFDGFTFYPNTISYGALTNVGSPGLYGGYEYTPENMNARDDVSLGDKQNEALKVMPVLFDQEGYDVTVFDPTYAGYSWTPDLSIYDDYPDIKTYVTMDGSFETTEFGPSPVVDSSNSVRSRNFFCYSLFKVSPLFLQPTLYNEGNYNASTVLKHVENTAPTTIMSPQVRTGISNATGVDEEFLNPYAVLENMTNMTYITESPKGSFLMMSNDTTHEPMLLQEPECVPALEVDNVAYDQQTVVRYDAQGNSLDFSEDTENKESSKHMHYQIDVAGLQQLGNWFDYLREQGVYDNTRIIIVSDHARDLYLDEDLVMEIMSGETNELTERDMLEFNCTLLVKDFNSEGFTINDEFMTNADTPTIAFGGIVDNPVNPSTGNPIDSSGKDKPEQHVMFSSAFDIDDNNGNTFIPGDWFAVSGNIFDPNNWSYIGYY